jgi:hypothetical protein
VEVGAQDVGIAVDVVEFKNRTCEAKINDKQEIEKNPGSRDYRI